MNIVVEKSPKGVYKDFEDYLKEIIVGFKIKDKLSFRKDLEKLIDTIDVGGKNDPKVYGLLLFKLIEKYGG